MKTQMNLKLFLNLMAAILIIPMSKGIGGEIGNAHWIRYVDKVSDLELNYPETWDRMDVGPSVSFLEKKTSTENLPCVVNISSEGVDSIQSFEDLKKDLEETQPQKNWVPIKLAGTQGLESEEEGRTLIYLYRSNGAVLNIRSRCQNGEKAVLDTKKIIESIQLR